MVLLRCQIHTELAKCEEDEEQIQVAMEHLRKVEVLPANFNQTIVWIKYERVSDKLQQCFP